MSFGGMAGSVSVAVDTKNFSVIMLYRARREAETSPQIAGRCASGAMTRSTGARIVEDRSRMPQERRRAEGYSSVSGGALSLRVRGIYPPADHFSFFVLRYNFAIEL